MYLEKLSIAILLYMDTIAIRIRESRTLRGFSQKNLADAIGVTPAAISQYESESDSATEPTVKNLSKISDALDISFEWLATGRGVQGIEEFLIDITEMYRNDQRLVLLNEDQKEVLEIYDNLPEDWQEKYRFLLKATQEGLIKE